MTFAKYLEDKIYILIFNLFSIFLLSIFLYLTGTSFGIIILILIIWSFMKTIGLLWEYINQRNYFNDLISIMNTLDKKYLFIECVPKPKKNTDKLYFDLIRQASKSMAENISEIKNEKDEYKEYIESWVHEIKIPITAIQLICENNKNDITKKILYRLEQIWLYAETSLYYARSNDVEKDFIIVKNNIKDIVDEVLFRNKQILIQNNIKIETNNLNRDVYTDSKWLSFILNQILQNSVKYKNSNPIFTIATENTQKGLILSMHDNGVGIEEYELGKVFEKGFTGIKGRNEKKSTGIGLYLCKKLCIKLGIDIYAESKIGEYTKINMLFPLAHKQT